MKLTPVNGVFVSEMDALALVLTLWTIYQVGVLQ